MIRMTAETLARIRDRDKKTDHCFFPQDGYDHGLQAELDRHVLLAELDRLRATRGGCRCVWCCSSTPTDLRGEAHGICG